MLKLGTVFFSMLCLIPGVVISIIKKGLRKGEERFSEFANILFLKIIGEIEEEKEKSTQTFGHREIKIQRCGKSICLEQRTLGTKRTRLWNCFFKSSPSR